MIKEVASVPGNIFDRLSADFDAPYEIGSWFLVNNLKIFKAWNRKRFAEKTGQHPVVLRTRYNPGRHGPNVTGYPRSASVGTGFEHEAHLSHNGQSTCRINKKGWVKLDIAVVVSYVEISANTFSCCEETNSGLMRKIGVAS